MFRETAYHRNLGPEKDKSAVCLLREGQPKCPVCEVISELYKLKTDEDKEYAKSIKAQTRAIYNIIDLDEPEKGPQIYMSGVDVMEQILRYIANPKYGAIDNPQTGRNCTVTYTDGKSTRSGFPETNIQADPDTSTIADMEWLEKLHDLDAIVKAMDYDTLHALVWGTDVEDKPEEAKPAAKPAQQPPQQPPEEIKKKPVGTAPPCFVPAKFNPADEECIVCEYVKPCEDKKKAKAKPVEQPKPEPPKPEPKPAEAAKSTVPPKPKATGAEKESVKDLLGRLKKKEKEDVPF